MPNFGIVNSSIAHPSYRDLEQEGSQQRFIFMMNGLIERQETVETEDGSHTATRLPVPMVAMLLFNNSSIGGAERRYAWVYRELRRRQVPILLAINESLLRKLQEIGVLSEQEAPDFLLKERAGRMAFVLRKLDYVVGLLPLTLWLWRRRPQVLHLVLGGAYLALPSQLIGAAPPAVLSVVCPRLRGIAGTPLGCSLFRLALKLATRVDALTESVGQMVRNEGIGSERIHVPSGSCVDTHRFQPTHKQPWVVFSGRLVPEKDPLLFVRACALASERIKDRIPDLRMFLLGDGPLQGEVDALIKAQGLGSLMHVGWEQRVESVLNRAAVFVSLQQTDNYPSQALLEAMASGSAVIATDVGLTSKLVDDEIGRRVPADPQSVASAIIELLEKPCLTAAMGQRARAKVLQHHSLESYLTYIQNVYAGIG
jgi:glycosyltransferase involved in cell wall biosynthesis